MVITTYNYVSGLKIYNKVIEMSIFFKKIHRGQNDGQNVLDE